MSPSKKANKKVSASKAIGARKTVAKKTARSSRVASQKIREKKSKIARPTFQKTEKQPGAQNVQTFQLSNINTNVLRVFSLLAVIAITLYVFNIRERVEEFSALGYPGIFLIALLANATILVPAPGVAVIYAMGAVFNPLGVGFAAGSGGALGELSGYLAGFSGQAVVENSAAYERFQPWVEKYGGPAILVLAAIPNPFFDAAGIAAGIAKMPLRTFLFFVWIGQLIKMTLFAYAGKYSLEWIAQFLN